MRARTQNDDPERAVRETRLNGDYTQQESEWLVATGFLRMGPWDNAMVKSEEARHIYLDDVVNSVGQTFLSTTMRCVKCHDHKFDPIPTRDYYRLYAAFEATQMAERNAPFLESENLAYHSEGKAFVERMLDFAVSEKNKLKKKQEDAAKEWYEARNQEYVPEKQRQNLPDEEKPPRHVGLNHIEQGQLKVREQDEWIWKRRLERYEPMIQSVYNGSNEAFKWNGARKLRINPKQDPKWSPDSRILIGGAIEAPGEKVLPGVLSAVGLAVPSEMVQEINGTALRFQIADSKKLDPYVLPTGVEGRRTALAKWIVHPENGLALRSIANRLWQYHFGRGLAANANNFGAKGAKPTHPELLDYLASEIIAGDWKLKRMHRKIMLSKAYRMASKHRRLEELQTVDPQNELLAFYPVRRLSAEEIRDSLLMATGELVEQVGGLPVMPEINMEVALAPRMIQFSLAPAYQPDVEPNRRNRRTIYAYRVRGLADPFLELFNRPNPNDSCEVRDQASVTPQAFSLLNSDMITDRSIAMAARLKTEREKLSDQLDLAFQLILSRLPDDRERMTLSNYVRDMEDYHRENEPAARSYPAQITRSLVEEFSGEPFEYEEILPAFEDYQSDLQASEIDAATRALADCCLLLFNSNEFAFIY